MLDTAGVEVDKNDKKFVLENLSSFDVNCVLSEDCSRKRICVEGTFKDREGRAILIFEQNVISDENFKELLTEETKIEQTFANDIYRKYNCFSERKSLNNLKLTVIYPASEDDIKKCRSCSKYIIHETSELYKTVTLPNIERRPLNLQWVHDILEKKAEQERILCEDQSLDLGFVLVPHLKWDQTIVDDLHLVAIVRRHGIKTIRDLTSEHLPLLRHLREKVNQFIKDKYDICSSQIVIFLHYLPSYYHLHIHFANLKCEDAGTNTEEAYLLSDIIDNIGLLPDYYKKATLTFVVKESEDLFLAYKDLGLLDVKEKELKGSELPTEKGEEALTDISKKTES